MPIANYVKNRVLNIITGQNVSLGNQTVYLALATAAPVQNGETVTFTEVQTPGTNGYARAIVGSPAQSLTQTFGPASAGVVTNNKQIKFDMATGAWPQATYGVLVNAATGGQVLGWGELTTPITVGNSEVAVVLVNGIQISILDEAQA